MSKQIVCANIFVVCVSHIFKSITKHKPLIQTVRCSSCCSTQGQKPQHLICFKQWSPEKVKEILQSAMNLKCLVGDTHNKKMDILPNTKVMILQEVNEPILHMAISKAASFLGAADVTITDSLLWDYDYHGRIFSDMADIIFVATKTHMCIQRFAAKSSAPVLCVISRTHASLQSLATIMAIMEQFGTVKAVNLAYIGSTHPVLNSFLLLCPMLGANIRFKCSCKSNPVSPLLYNASKELTVKTATQSKQCETREEALKNACVVISGPTPKNKDLIKEFSLTCADICKETDYPWIFFHTCPRGEEVDNDLFFGERSRTFDAFQNMQFIAAALIAKCVKDYKF